MRQVSLCLRYKPIQERYTMPFLSYAVPDYDNELFFVVYNFTAELSCCADPSFALFMQYKLVHLQWTSICLAMDFPNLSATWFINGDKYTYDLDHFKNKPDTKIRGGGLLFIGQEQDLYGGGFTYVQTLRGVIADFVMYDGLYSDADMKAFTQCMATDLPNFISFGNFSSNFETSDVVVGNVNVTSELCGKSEPRLIIYDEQRTGTEARDACSTIRADIFIPQSAEENREFFLLATTYEDICRDRNRDFMWLGGYGNEEEQMMYNYNTKKPNPYSNKFQKYIFDAGCTAMEGVLSAPEIWHGKWSQRLACDSHTACTPCKIDELRFIKIRGLCKNSYFDREFFPIERNRTVVYLGKQYCVIFSTPGNLDVQNDFGEWNIIKYDMPRVKAIAKRSSPTDFPIGVKTWQIFNDKCLIIKTKLAITLCQKNEFTCENGKCIPLSVRCNLEINCEDGSDENDCSPLILPKEYSNRISPPRFSSLEPLKILFKMDIFTIREFDITQFKVSFDALLELSWIDKRVRFRNLKQFLRLNGIEINDESQSPWLPILEVIGDGNSSTNAIETYQSLLARRDTSPLPDSIENVREDEIFLGAENHFVLKKKMTISMACQFNFGMFPFDNQLCGVTFLLSQTTNNYAVMEASQSDVRFLGERRLLEYLVSAVKIYPHTEDLHDGRKIQFIFKNLFTYYIISAFIPTFIMLIIGGSCFLFPIEDFNSRAMVALTALLVEASLFGQVNESIPKTAYFKFIDVWFTFCILALFLTNITIAIINYFYYGINDSNVAVNEVKVFVERFSPKMTGMEDRRRKALILNKIMLISFPCAIFLFLIIYSLISIINYNLNVE